MSKMLVLFSFTLFLSAFLLFAVQPMIGKMILPLLGGVPSVWNTCLFFFQAVLLLGYAYVHWLSAPLLLHVFVLGLPWLVLPLSIPSSSLGLSPVDSPLTWLLLVLSVRGAAPFFALSTTAPLVQTWFSRTKHPSARDPFFLYVASNSGSLLGLLAYPLILERFLSVGEQTRVWAWGFGIFTVCVAACAWVARGNKAMQSPEVVKVSTRRSLHWILCSVVPSSLLLGVTTYLSSEVGSFPLLWTIPLALYLVSFMLVFSNRGARVFAFSSRWVGLGILPLLIAILNEATEPWFLVIPLHLLTFFLACNAAHGALAKDRPGAGGLTQYYFCMSLGGALGGLFGALVAPMLIPMVWEYPLALILVILFREGMNQPWEKSDGWWPLGIAIVTFALGLVVMTLDLGFGRAITLLMFGIPAILVYRGLRRNYRFALGLLALFLAGLAFPRERGKALLVSRNFFGVLRVTLSPSKEFHQLVHGNTLHGSQVVALQGRKEPRLYYSRRGPAGDILSAGRFRSVGVIGLGTGALACLASPQQEWTFYEIDPAVMSIARDSGFFSYLKDCSPQETKVVMGDARLRIQDAPDGAYDLLVVDAFSSDVIPSHLVTLEALQLYWRKISKEGMLAFHISNRYLDLKPVLFAASEALGKKAFLRDHQTLGEKELADGLTRSEWVLMGDREPELPPSWSRLSVKSPLLWTDDRYHLVSILKF